MAAFTYRYRRAATGRINTARRTARNEAALLSDLARDPQVSEVISVERLPPEPATAPQMQYLRSLIGYEPVNITKEEASDLIDNAQKTRQPGSDKDRALAEKFDVEVTRFASKPTIFNRITWTLEAYADQDPQSLARWYVYRVYRDAFDRTDSGGLDDPDDARFARIANEIAGDAGLVRLLRKAAKENVCGFRWFGELVSQHGEMLIGESDRTKVYAAAAGGLKSAGLYPAEGRSRGARRIPPAGENRRGIADYQPPVTPRTAPAPKGSAVQGFFILLMLLGIVIFVGSLF